MKLRGKEKRRLMETSRRTFEDLSIHQKLMFLHNFMRKVLPLLVRTQKDLLKFDYESAPDKDLLKKILLYRCLKFANDPANAQVIIGIYRALRPGDDITLPSRMRCHSIIMMLMVQLYNEFYPKLDKDKILDLCILVLMEFKAINEAEAQNLTNVYEFRADTRTLTFRFQEDEYLCQLNPKNGYGYELTVLRGSGGVPTKK
jgi:hypothetical protein